MPTRRSLSASSTAGSGNLLQTCGLYLLLVLLPQGLWVCSLFTQQRPNRWYQQCGLVGGDGGCYEPSIMRSCNDGHGGSKERDTTNKSKDNNGSTLLYLCGLVNVSQYCACEVRDNEETMERLPAVERDFIQVHGTTSVPGLDVPCQEEDDSSGGWFVPHSIPSLAPGPCTIQRRDSSLTQEMFLEKFAFTEPVILEQVTAQTAFRLHSTKRQLLKTFGQELITVATANTHSYKKEKMSLCEYVEHHMKPQSMEDLGNETLYHFGDNDRTGWDPLFSLYQLPPYSLPGLSPVLSFGLAGPGTGVPFHVHGATFAETIYGRKRWLLYPPADKPLFDPDASTLHWVTHTLPHLEQEHKPMECTLDPGEVIYFPAHWWHATLNIDSTVFMSTFMA